MDGHKLHVAHVAQFPMLRKPASRWVNQVGQPATGSLTARKAGARPGLPRLSQPKPEDFPPSRVTLLEEPRFRGRFVLLDLGSRRHFADQIAAGQTVDE